MVHLSWRDSNLGEAWEQDVAQLAGCVEKHAEPEKCLTVWKSTQNWRNASGSKPDINLETRRVLTWTLRRVDFYKIVPGKF